MAPAILMVGMLFPETVSLHTGFEYRKPELWHDKWKFGGLYVVPVLTSDALRAGSM